jgi:hypothetical protein
MLDSAETVTIIPVPGVWYPATGITAPSPATPEAALAIRELLRPAKFADGDPRLTCNPVMPATAPVLGEPSASLTRAPLKGAPGPISGIAYRSGARSAVVPTRKSTDPADWIIAETSDGDNLTPDPAGQILVRLKGCGMWLTGNDVPFPGITLRKDETWWSEWQRPGDDVIEIRGVAFRNTSATEQWVLSQLKPLFNSLALKLGNLPLGVWEYGALEGDLSPLVPKCVSVMQTFGDKRLETHLLGGLEQIVTRIPPAEAAAAAAAVLAVYEAQKAVPPGDALANRSYVKVGNLKKNHVWRGIEPVLGSLAPIAIEGLAPIDLAKVGFLATEAVLPALSGEPLLLVKLYARLGWDAGRILAGLHRSGHLWGTFCDHNLQELHCNAHTDNLIVLSDVFGAADGDPYQLVAPVDFDMAFAREQAVSVWADPPIPDPTMVTDQFSAEVGSFIQDLAGITAVIPGISTAIHVRDQPTDPGQNALLWIGRDLAAYEAFRAYQEPLVDRTDVIGLPASLAAGLVRDALEATRGKCS